jgi:hypothetical protein
MTTNRLTTPWWALRAALGAAAFLAGLDKYFNLLADWPGYLSPLATSLLPFSASAFMHLIGIVEMAVGVVILAGHAAGRLWRRLAVGTLNPVLPAIFRHRRACGHGSWRVHARPPHRGRWRDGHRT